MINWMNLTSNIGWVSITGLNELDELGRLKDESHRALQQTLDLLQELCRGHAVENPVIDREGDPHPLAGDHLAVLDDRLVLDRADRQDARIGRIDDRGELGDVV